MPKALNIRGTPRQVFDTHATSGMPLGTRMHVGGGRVFRYTKNDNTALSAARVVQAAAPNWGLKNLEVTAQTSAGEHNVTVRIARGEAINLNEYEDGWMYVNDGTGEGYLYHIAMSPAISGTATTDAVFQLENPAEVHITTSARVTFLKNRYRDVIQAEAPPDSAVLGVVPVAVTANYCFWLQTAGPAVVLQQDDLVVNRPVSASRCTAGAVSPTTLVVPFFPNRAESHGATGLAIMPTLDEDKVCVKERLMEITGIAVVPEISLGWCVNPAEHGQHCLVWLTQEG